MPTYQAMLSAVPGQQLATVVSPSSSDSRILHGATGQVALDEMPPLP
jgi:hypothetical protein